MKNSTVQFNLIPAKNRNCSRDADEVSDEKIPRFLYGEGRKKSFRKRIKPQSTGNIYFRLIPLHDVMMNISITLSVSVWGLHPLYQQMYSAILLSYNGFSDTFPKCSPSFYAYPWQNRMENELKFKQPLTHMTLHRHPKYPLGKYSSIGEAESKCFTMRKVILFVSRFHCLYQEILL